MKDKQHIYILVDYKNNFESKHFDEPIGSGMDKIKLKEYFNESGYIVHYKNFSTIEFREKFYKNKYILYTSSEDKGYYYKGFIEDIIFGLHLMGAKVIPEYKYLHANNNKVFMEILRDLSKCPKIKTIETRFFGCLEELKISSINFDDKKVVKLAQGAKSRGVFLSKSKQELVSLITKNCRTKNLFFELKEIYRKFKYKGYQLSSKHRKKFAVQNLINGLYDDWKLLIFNEKYFLLNRQNRPNDFRASGSGLFSFDNPLPEGILDFAESVYDSFNVPVLSIDVGFDGKIFHLIEFQMLYFGKTTFEEAPHFFYKNNGKWIKVYNDCILEQEYVNSVVSYIKRNYE